MNFYFTTVVASCILLSAHYWLTTCRRPYSITKPPNSRQGAFKFKLKPIILNNALILKGRKDKWSGLKAFTSSRSLRGLDMTVPRCFACLHRDNYLDVAHYVTFEFQASLNSGITVYWNIKRVFETSISVILYILQPQGMHENSLNTNFIGFISYLYSTLRECSNSRLSVLIFILLPNKIIFYQYAIILYKELCSKNTF